jgi:hypothetical protein
VRDPKLDRYENVHMEIDIRPYRVFIMTPVIFCCAALFLLSRGIFSAPLQALFAAIFILVGVPLYYVFITGWRYIPGLRMEPIIPVLTAGYFGIKPQEGTRLRGFSLTSINGRDRGYSLASQGHGRMSSEEVEMTQRT